MGKWNVFQIGARMHYAVPRILFRHGMLGKLITDVTITPSFLQRLKRLNRRASEKIERYRVPEIDSSQIESHLFRGLVFKLGIWRSRNQRLNYAQSCIEIARKVGRQIRTETSEGIYAFDTAALEAFDSSRCRGKKILEQCIAPRNLQKEVYLSNCDANPDCNQIEAFDLLYQREKEEWKHADRIVAPSKFVADAIISSGIERNRIRVVPYGVTPPNAESVSKSIELRFASTRKTCRVLFAGTLSSRKGVYDVYEISKSLVCESIEFVLAGTVSQEAKSINWPPNVTILGPISRNKIELEFRNADIFLLPTYLEGSATVTYEAMGWGLPMVTTEAAGSVARDEVEAFIVNAGDREAMIDRILRLCRDRELRQILGKNAQRRIDDGYSLDGYGQRLLKVFKEFE